MTNNKKKDGDSMEKILRRFFSKGENVVVSISGVTMIVKIVEILFNIKTLVARTPVGTYFYPFDKIDYVMAVCKTKIENLKKEKCEKEKLHI
jgi:hypothetical protein